MQPIKFKAFHVHTKKMYSWEYILQLNPNDFYSLYMDSHINSEPYIILPCTDILDKNGIEIYKDDILLGHNNVLFRIYQVPGGFAMKGEHWSNNIHDLKPSDDLILSSIAEPQNHSYIKNCVNINKFFMKSQCF